MMMDQFCKNFVKGRFYITVIKDIILIFIRRFEMWSINIVYLVTFQSRLIDIGILYKLSTSIVIFWKKKAFLF